MAAPLGFCPFGGQRFGGAGAVGCGLKLQDLRVLVYVFRAPAGGVFLRQDAILMAIPVDRSLAAPKLPGIPIAPLK